MTSTRTRWEVPAITGDPSFLLAAPSQTADGFHGLAEQLRPRASGTVAWIPAHFYISQMIHAHEKLV